MSLSVLTQGGGGSGGTSASIIVNGLSESDVVRAVHSSGKTINGKLVKRPNPAIVVPEGYTQLEYIKGTGTQYINTLIPNNGLVDFSVTFEQDGWANENDKQHLVLGSNDAWNGNSNDKMNMLWITSDEIYLAYNNYQFSKFSDFILGNKYSIEKKDGVLKVDGVSVGSYSQSSFSITPPIHLFCGYQQNMSSTTYKFVGKIYDCKIWDENDNLVLYFIPCKNADSEVGMYDLITNQFFKNSGTGEFIAGKEIPQYTYYHEVSKINKYGTWTVEATDGEQTTTQDVLVDAAAEYEIEMSYKLWLYREGDECTDVTGGWNAYPYASTELKKPSYGNSSGSVVLTKDDSNMTVQQPTAARVGGVFTEKAIDTTSYTFLCWEGSWVSPGADGPAGWVEVANAKTDNYTRLAAIDLYNGYGKIDISTLQKSVYIAVSLGRSYANTGTPSITTKNIWLE